MPFLVDGADLDGTNDFMARGAALDNDADTKLAVISVWCRIDGGDGAMQRFLRGVNTAVGNAGRGFALSRSAGNLIQLNGTISNGTQILTGVGTTISLAAGASWRHILVAFDLADTGKRFVYIDDAAETMNYTVYTDAAMAITAAGDWGAGGSPNGSEKFNGCLAEMMFWPGQYLDLSVEANRRMFRSAAGFPVDPSVTGGAIDTLGTPKVHFHLDDGEAVAGFATNRGDGGDFTITGTLDTASTSPSDGQEPVADFSGTPLTGDAPLNVQFTDLTTNDPTSWAWDFGDSETSTAQNPLHTYGAEGTYTVELTATSNAGSDAETKVGYITVAAAAEVPVKTGGKGDNEKQRTLRAVKPTGLAPRRKAQVNPAVEARVAETAEIAREVSRETDGGALAPVVVISMAEVDAEIRALLQKAMRSEEEDVLLLTLMAAAAA